MTMFVKNWKMFTEGRMIDFNTRKEIVSDEDINDTTETDNVINKNDIEIIDYSENSIAVIGNTFQIKDKLSKAGGRFNKFLTINGKKQSGWIFPKKRKEVIDNIINNDDTYTTDVIETPKVSTEKQTSEYLSHDSNLYKIFGIDNEEIPVINDLLVAKDLLENFKKFVYDKYIFLPEMTNRQKPALKILKDAPKSRIGYVVIQYFGYTDIERMVEKGVEFIESLIKISRVKTEKTEKNARLKSEILNNIDKYLKIGDIFYDSWGYEQTNIDFYQVVKIDKKSAWLQEIKGEYVKGSEYHDSANVKPIKDSFIKDSIPERKLISIIGDTNPEIYFKSKFGYISRYTNGNKGVYSSWGY